jgi:AcrR family transcriptional regulator
VLAAANQVADARGLVHTTLEAVAQAAGVSKPAILFHFKSKGALLAELLRADARAIAAEIRHQRGQGERGPEALDRQVQAVLRRLRGSAVSEALRRALVGTRAERAAWESVWRPIHGAIRVAARAAGLTAPQATTASWLTLLLAALADDLVPLRHVNVAAACGSRST